MSLVSAMSNDENLTPAASRDFSRAARRAADRQPDVTDAEDEIDQVNYFTTACTPTGSFCEMSAVARPPHASSMASIGALHELADASLNSCTLHAAAKSMKTPVLLPSH